MHTTYALFRLWPLTVVILVATLSGCLAFGAHQPPVGSIFTGVKAVSPNTQVEIANEPRPGPRSGQACTMAVLGIAAWGDMSLAAAKRSGNITRVDTLDYERVDVLGGLYQKRCTVITGA